MIRHAIAWLLSLAFACAPALVQAQVPLPAGVGLYANGANVLSATLDSAAVESAQLIVPRKPYGVPVPDWSAGAVVMLSIGESNVAWRWCAKTTTTAVLPCTANSLTGQAAGKSNPRVRIIAGAMGGQTVDTWIGPTNYDIVRRRMPAGAEAQVQVIWFEMAHRGPTDSTTEVDALVRDGGAALRAMSARYPNLRLIYLSAREYGGWATIPLNPEPYAYQSGIAARALILAQDAQRNGAPADSLAGDLAGVPVLLWGPYLWNPNAPRSDFVGDGTHPSPASITRQAGVLLGFWKTDPTSVCWFPAVRGACS